MSIQRYRSVNAGTIYKVEKSILTVTMVENGKPRLVEGDEANMLLANWAKDRCEAPGFATRMNSAIDELVSEVEDINKIAISDDESEDGKDEPSKTKIFTAKCDETGQVDLNYQTTYLRNYADSVLYGIFPSPRDSFKLKSGKAVLLNREVVYSKLSRLGYALDDQSEIIAADMTEILNEVSNLYPESVQKQWYDAAWERLKPEIEVSTYDSSCLMLTMLGKVIATFKRPVITDIEVPKTYSKW